MSYQQYTSCVDAKNHVGMNLFIQATIQALIAGVIGGLFVAAAGEPWCLLIVAEIMAIMWVVAFCHWWLEDRLICLDGDRSAAGMVVSNEPASEKSGLDAFDTDFSINLLLLHTDPGVDQVAAQASAPYGELIKEQDATKNESLPFTGTMATDEGTGIESAVLHAEFEGAGITDLLLAHQIALGIATAALIVCLAGGPWGAIIAAALAILAFLAMLLGALVGRGDTASPEDAGLPSIETNKTDGTGADILGVMGRWVYDAGHNHQGRGWNEIHPIKTAQKLGVWDGDWPEDIDQKVRDWEDKVGEASSPLTVEGQKRPENRWQIHPLIDGCTPQSDDDVPR